MQSAQGNEKHAISVDKHRQCVRCSSHETTHLFKMYSCTITNIQSKRSVKLVMPYCSRWNMTSIKKWQKTRIVLQPDISVGGTEKGRWQKYELPARRGMHTVSEVLRLKTGESGFHSRWDKRLFLSTPRPDRPRGPPPRLLTIHWITDAGSQGIN